MKQIFLLFGSHCWNLVLYVPKMYGESHRALTWGLFSMANFHDQLFYKTTYETMFA